MKSKRYFKIIFLGGILAASNPAVSQSYYSQIGIGLPQHFGSGQSAGMGGVGLAFKDPLTLNYLNPAALTNLNLTYVSGNFRHVVSSLKSTAQSATISDTNVNGFMFHIPLKTSRFSTAIGLSPYSTIEYSFEADGSISETPFQQIITGDGGINTAFLSFGFSPFRRLSFGVTGLYYFGRLRDVQRVIFGDDDFRNTRHEIASSFTAGNIRFGMQAAIAGDWTVAAVVTPSVSFNAKRTVTLQNIKTFDDFDDSDIKLPFTYGVGTSALIGKLLLGADYMVEKWSDIEGDGFRNDGRLFGFGVEFSGRGKSLNSSYLSRISVRAGIRHRDLGIEQPAGNKVTETMATWGLGLPFKWRAARLDIALEYGQRGSIEKNPVRERIVRFSTTVTVGEKWFYRRGSR